MKISDKKIKEVIAAFIKVARHVRNYPHPELPIERLRSEAVEAEALADQILGRDEYEKICKIAFKKQL